MGNIKKKGKNGDTVPRGKPKSGRIWKNTKTKFSLNVKTKGLKNSLEKKEIFRKEMQAVKELSRSIKAARQEEKEKRKERRRENLKRQEENRKKSEIVQVISNTSKIKKMRKKQLRNIEKRDTSKVM
ncbi:hypothetical protein HHI36_002579 [Cryptolaemus montrouzieri]|uniref:Coiled-coil domain-containing protein 86 n=1 Tax=Cryptolaemus montrouzieri TaxID=559131 RepID=A0ABD2PBE6_9CUCU